MEKQSFESATFRRNGPPEVAAPWLSEHLSDVRLVDVREPHELDGVLGVIGGAENVPLHTVLTVGIDPSDKPLVLVCRSGRRSALAASILEDRGVGRVASVEGGMLAWNVQVEGRSCAEEDEKKSNAENLESATYRVNGPPEVSASWVAANLGRFRLIDVREPAEVEAAGHIVQSEKIPMGEMLQAFPSWPKDHPVVVHCASGGRSGRIAMAMEQAGFTRVASMEGGMIGWTGRDLPSA